MTAPKETKDVAALFEFQEHGTLSAVGAELVSLSDDTTGVPSATDVNGNALTPRGVYVGVAGDLTVDMADGITSILFKNVPVGVFPIAVSKIYKTGTGASSLVFLY